MKHVTSFLDIMEVVFCAVNKLACFWMPSRKLETHRLSCAGLWIDMNEPSNFATDLCGAAGALRCSPCLPAVSICDRP